jgi:hypothetical protein
MHTEQQLEEKLIVHTGADPPPRNRANRSDAGPIGLAGG